MTLLKHLFPALLLAGIGVHAAASAGAEPDLLDPEVAFKFSARMINANTVEVRYDIAPGYYMYRGRFGFEVDGARSQAATPRGKKKFDITFNKTMETYRQQVLVTVPLTPARGGVETVALKVTSQGCADAGVCYPPQIHTARLRLAQAASAAPENASSTVPRPSAFSAIEPAVTSAAQPTAKAQTQAKAVPGHNQFVRVASVDDAAQKISAAGRVTLLDFHADWCAPCKQMEKATWSDKRVRAKLAQFATLQADVTRNTLDDKLLLKRYKLIGPPGIVFFDKSGQEIPGLRVIGFEAPEKFLQTLERALRVR